MNAWKAIEGTSYAIAVGILALGWYYNKPGNVIVTSAIILAAIFITVVLLLRQIYGGNSKRGDLLRRFDVALLETVGRCEKDSDVAALALARDILEARKSSSWNQLQELWERLEKIDNGFRILPDISIDLDDGWAIVTLYSDDDGNDEDFYINLSEVLPFSELEGAS